MRGLFDYIPAFPAYKDSPRIWHITPTSGNCFWFDLIVNPPEFADTEGFIAAYLAELKRQVEATLEKRFIYFLASRTKVRLNVTRPPHFSYFRQQLVVNFLVGTEKRKVRHLDS